MLTLWDLIEPLFKPRGRAAKESVSAKPRPPTPDRRPRSGEESRRRAGEGSREERGTLVAGPHRQRDAGPAQKASLFGQPRAENGSRTLPAAAVAAAPAAQRPPHPPHSPRRSRSGSAEAQAGRSSAPTSESAAAEQSRPAALRESAQDKYDRVVADMLREHGVRVRKWRTSMSGIAWYVTYKDGRQVRLIEAPKPKGPMSIAVFLHEIGHHAIGFNRYKPRCLEEYHAWAWAIAKMQELDLNITDAVRHRMSMSLWYAVAKAQRRGIREVPVELEPYLTRPVRGD